MCSSKIISSDQTILTHFFPLTSQMIPVVELATCCILSPTCIDNFQFVGPAIADVSIHPPDGVHRFPEMVERHSDDQAKEAIVFEFY